MARGTAIIGEGAAVAAVLARYRRHLLPGVRRELAGWREVAGAIPDPDLRSQAIDGLTRKAGNAEAIGVLAALAPRRSRRTVIRASTALQVAVDYLDNLGEQPGPDPLRDGLELHAPLAAALDPAAEAGDRYARRGSRGDGGYLDRLVAACRQSAGSLPAAEQVLPLARRAIVRCGEGQSHTHASASGSSAGLEEWASGLPAPAGYEWWEIAAGASSSVAAHALLALAGTPGSTPAQAELVDDAYFPSIGALTVLLDDLVDRQADRSAGQHNYLEHYPSDAAAAERLEAIAAMARRSISQLPHPALHGAIISGILAFYLSSPGAAAPGTRIIRDQLLASSGPVVMTLARILRQGKRPGQAGNPPGP